MKNETKIFIAVGIAVVLLFAAFLAGYAAGRPKVNTDGTALDDAGHKLDSAIEQLHGAWQYTDFIERELNLAHEYNNRLAAGLDELEQRISESNAGLAEGERIIKESAERNEYSKRILAEIQRRRTSSNAEESEN